MKLTSGCKSRSLFSLKDPPQGAGDTWHVHYRDGWIQYDQSGCSCGFCLLIISSSDHQLVISHVGTTTTTDHSFDSRWSWTVIIIYIVYTRFAFNSPMIWFSPLFVLPQQKFYFFLVYLPFQVFPFQGMSSLVTFCETPLPPHKGFPHPPVSALNKLWKITKTLFVANL